MLAAEFGGLRPWEMCRLTPSEEAGIMQRQREVG